MNNNYYKWFPFKLLKRYVLVLLALSIIGPVEFGYDGLYLCVTVIYIFLFLVFTYFGMQKNANYTPSKEISASDEQGLIRIIKAITIFIFPIKVLLVISSIKVMGMPHLNNFFSSLAQVYTDMHAGTEENIYRKIDTFTTFLFYISTFMGLYWRGRLGRTNLFIVLINVVLDLFYQLAFIGTQRSIITIGVVCLTLILTSAMKKGVSIDKRKLRTASIIIALLLIVFLNILSARKSLWNNGNESYIYKSRRYNLDSPLLFWCSNDKLKYDICNLCSYFTQGFYGLSLSFQMPFKWTYGLGSTRGLNSIISQVFPFIPSMTEYTYPVRAGEVFNFDGLANWYGIFPWLASDFTFIGTLFYMGAVGWLYMRCWIQSVKHENPIAFTLLVLLNIQYIFIIANNQLFVQRGEALATVVIVVIYFICNKRYNKINKDDEKAL